MRKKIILSGMTAAFVFLAFSFGFGQNPPERPGFQSRGERLAEFLNLTSEQKTKLQEIRKARQEDRQAFREEMSKLRPQLREAVKDPKADEKKIDGLVDQMAQLRAAHLKSALHSLKDMEKVLTPEQLEKFRSVRSRMGRRHGFGRGFGPRRWMRPGWGPRSDSGFGWGFDGWL